MNYINELFALQYIRSHCSPCTLNDFITPSIGHVENVGYLPNVNTFQTPSISLEKSSSIGKFSTFWFLLNNSKDRILFVHFLEIFHQISKSWKTSLSTSHFFKMVFHEKNWFLSQLQQLQKCRSSRQPSYVRMHKWLLSIYYTVK